MFVGDVEMTCWETTGHISKRTGTRFIRRLHFAPIDPVWSCFVTMDESRSSLENDRFANIACIMLLSCPELNRRFVISENFWKWKTSVPPNKKEVSVPYLWILQFPDMNLLWSILWSLLFFLRYGQITRDDQSNPKLCKYSRYLVFQFSYLYVVVIRCFSAFFLSSDRDWMRFGERLAVHAATLADLLVVYAADCWARVKLYSDGETRVIRCSDGGHAGRGTHSRPD